MRIIMLIVVLLCTTTIIAQNPKKFYVQVLYVISQDHTSTTLMTTKNNGDTGVIKYSHNPMFRNPSPQFFSNKILLVRPIPGDGCKAIIRITRKRRL
jgi:hypothetical protein